MKISVIIPYLKGEQYLRDCLDSLGSVAGCDVEPVVMCDNPEAPAGTAAMRNRGIETASGDWCLFLDSDDYLSPDALEVLVDAAVYNPGKLIRLPFKKTWYKRASELNEDENSVIAEDRFDGSILGLLIPMEYIRSGALRFNEEYRYYSDLPFLAGLLNQASIVNAGSGIYYKRSHNDAIRFPSLSQEKNPGRFEELEKAFTEALCINPGEYISQCVLDYIGGKLMKGKHPEGLELPEEELKHLAAPLKKIDDAIIAKQSRQYRSVYRRLRQGRIPAAVRRAKLFVMNRKKKGLFGTPLQWKWNIYKRIFRKFKVDDKLILFESFLGKSYGDSCRGIYEYMQREKEAKGSSCPWADWHFVWVIDNHEAEIPGEHTEVRPQSLKYFYYVARAGKWVNNMRQPAWYEKRKGVTFLETWHGTPLKKLVFDMEDVHSASPEYKMIFYKQSRIWDYLLSDNAFSTQVFKNAFLFPEERILELGYPRNDILYAEDRQARAAAVKKKLNIPADKKVVLYAPTWRDDDYYGPGRYKFSLPLDLGLMEELKDSWHFVLRTHYFIADNLKLMPEQKEFVTDCSHYNDIGELYLIADVLITDYSSVFFDYANLRRPILFYVYDFEKYRDTLRGFYFDMEHECPGPLLYTSEQVRDALADIEAVSDGYADKYNSFCDKFCYLDDGHASERIVKRVFTAEQQ